MYAIRSYYVLKVGDEVAIVGLKDTTKTTCTGVEMFRKLLAPRAQPILDWAQALIST